jgi:hypothetical protein
MTYEPGTSHGRPGYIRNGFLAVTTTKSCAGYHNVACRDQDVPSSHSIGTMPFDPGRQRLTIEVRPDCVWWATDAISS